MSSLQKVAIFGASGKVGRFLCDKLLKEKFQPLAIVRKEEQASEFKSKGINAAVVSVEDSNVKTIADAIKGYDVVVFTAGAGGKGGADRTVQVDLDGAVKTMEASVEAKIQRYIIVSAFKADDREAWWNSPLRTYYIAKKYADAVLRSTNLDYTILQPGLLKDDAGTGKIAPIANVYNLDHKQWVIEREDVATAVVESIKTPTTIRKTLPLVNGDVSIADALKVAL